MIEALVQAMVFALDVVLLVTKGIQGNETSLAIKDIWLVSLWSCRKDL